MKTASETLNPTRVRLTVEVGFDEISADVAGAYKKIGQQVSVPGFRRGKVPTRILDQRVGRGAVLEEAVNEALPKLYARAVRDEDISPLGRPDIEITELEDNARLAFTAEVDVRPDLDLPDLNGIEVEVEDADVADDAVEAALALLRERFATLAGVERPAAEGDFVSLDLSAARDGEPLEGVQVTGQSYRVGSKSMIDGLDEAVTGLSAGESATFAAPLLGEYAGQDADVTVSVGAVKEQVLPPLDDEFASLASEFDTLEALRADTRTRLVRERTFAQQRTAREKLLDTVLERIEVPLPEAIVEDEIAARRSGIEEQLASANTDLSSYLASRSETEEDFLAELTTQARNAMKSQFVLDALVKKSGVEVGQEEISGALIQLAQQSGMPPQQYIQTVLQNNSLGEVVGQVAREKALTALLDEAVVTDASGRRVDVHALHDHAPHEHAPAAAEIDVVEIEGDDDGDVEEIEVDELVIDAAAVDAAAGVTVEEIELEDVDVEVVEVDVEPEPAAETATPAAADEPVDAAAPAAEPEAAREG